METAVAAYLQMPQAPAAPKLPPPGALLKETFRFWRAHLRLFLVIAAVPATFTVMVELLGKPVPHALIVAAGITAVLAGIAGRIALMEAVAENGAPARGVVGAYHWGVRLIPPFLWLAALGGLAIIGGFFLFIVPGVLLTLWLSFAAYVLVGERKRGLAALVASWQYVRGYWLPVLWRFAFFGIATVLVTIAFALALDMMAALAGAAGAPGGGAVAERAVWGSIARELFGNLFVLPLSVIYAFSLFRALRQAKAAAAPPSPEETARMRKRLAILAAVGAVGTILIFAALGALILKYLPEIQNILKNAGVDAVAPNAFPQTPLNTAAGFIPLLRSLFGGQ